MRASARTNNHNKALNEAQSKIVIDELLALTREELLSRLNTSPDGLRLEEVEKRLELYGHNELARKKRRTVFLQLLIRLSSPLVLILLVAGLISAAVGEVVQTVIIFAIVLLSVLLDLYQEAKADDAAKELMRKVTTTATVMRGGVRQEVRLSGIVPGDIILLSAGDIVPADAEVISAKDMFVDQSALTGEAFPVEKVAKPLEIKGAPITEWNNYVFMGTSIVSGTASAVVIKTGSNTEYGNIASRLVSRVPETEAERGLRRFGLLIVQVTFVLVLLVFFINALFKRDVLESFLFAIALAVGMTPELLPMIVSVSLAKGALAMSKKGVIVKRLAAIQNFGSMDTLCTDKTGTITENKVTLVLHVDMDGDEDETVLLYSYLNSYFQTGLKSPLDGAILEKHAEVDITGYKKVDEIPFDFTRRRVSVVVERDGKRILMAKGAPEEIVKVCTNCLVSLDEEFQITSELHNRIEEESRSLADQGFRVLGVSYKILEEEKAVYSLADEEGLVFLGFVAFIDPPKESAKEAFEQLNKERIELKILTGDNEIVTSKTCEHLGFEIQGIITGNQLRTINDDALARIVEHANIFARVTPTQKDRVMNALKRNGHVVGYLGDGINDAPSLRTADVSLSVDNAVDIAKESADIILLQKDLRVLAEGVLEGRKTFGNILKYIMMQTSSNFGNMLSSAVASLFLPFLPMLPIQILLNNFLTDIAQTPIPTDNVDSRYLERPRRWDVAAIRRFMIILGPVSSVFDFLTFFVMIYLFHANESLFQTAWFTESLCTQALVIFVIRTRRTPFFKSKPAPLLLYSIISIVIVCLVLPYTPLGELFQFTRLPFTFYLFLVAIIIAYFGLAEFFKRLVYAEPHKSTRPRR